MSAGQKIKLAFKGNKEVRNILIRDSNKSISSAVVKSGRMSDGEIVSAASNRNLSEDVIRSIAMNKEYIRKYPVKVALAGNSKTPMPIAMTMLKYLQKQDLRAMGQNHNISSAVKNRAKKLYRQKFQRS